jgi:hypothetical protein
MLAFLRGKVSDRKFRLFSCACCRRIWHLLSDNPSRWVLKVAEAYADGMATLDEMSAAYSTIFEYLNSGEPGAENAACAVSCAANNSDDPHYCNVDALDNALAASSWAATTFANPSATHIEGGRAPREVAIRDCELANQAALLRDIVGNPFRPVSVDRAWLAWQDGTVIKLAQGLYEENAFDRLPILADALEEAGCSDVALLSHLRSPGPHVRGCFPVDLILGLT